ncbi:hypothetical protein EV421DRAFT_1743777 [Armillaria borealis]|uniref:YDG domain-containing protein n=1 Tax=Armillaria borealis TaxID=47425 RepID=A0AA39IW78_9AGAR|nr:hypothetical protein EV421DRAFT_1743777 [Armillaria borealis]
MIYTKEAFRFKKTHKFGKEEMRIMKDYRNLDTDKPKEREGGRKPVTDPGTVGEIEGQPVGTRYMDRTSALEAGVHGSLRRGIYSYKGSARSVVLSDGYEEFNKDKGDRIRLCGESGWSKDGKMQVKHQKYTHGNRALQKAMESDQPVRVIRGYRLHSKYAPNNGFCYDGLYKVTACYQKWDENGYKIILFKLERIPGQLPIGMRGKFWVYPESDAPAEIPDPAKVPEPYAPKKSPSPAPRKSFFPPRPKLPSFNKSKTSSYTLPANWQQVALNQSYPTHLNSDSGAHLSPVPAVKVEKYCDDTLQYPVKAESPVIATSSIPLLQYPEADIKTRTSPISARTSAEPPLHVKAESPPPARKRSGSTLGDPPPRKRQNVSTTPCACIKAESPPPFSLSERGPQKRNSHLFELNFQPLQHCFGNKQDSSSVPRRDPNSYIRYGRHALFNEESTQLPGIPLELAVLYLGLPIDKGLYMGRASIPSWMHAHMNPHVTTFNCFNNEIQVGNLFDRHIFLSLLPLLHLLALASASKVFSYMPVYPDGSTSILLHPGSLVSKD